MHRLTPDKVGLYKDYVARVFCTPGVKAVLNRDLGRLDADREAILSRQLQTALYGDDTQSVRAAALLIKVCGWEFRDDYVRQGSPDRPHVSTVSQPHPNSADLMDAMDEEKDPTLAIAAPMFLPVNQRVVGSSPTSGEVENSHPTMGRQFSTSAAMLRREPSSGAAGVS